MSTYHILNCWFIDPIRVIHKISVYRESDHHRPICHDLLLNLLSTGQDSHRASFTCIFFVLLRRTVAFISAKRTFVLIRQAIFTNKTLWYKIGQRGCQIASIAGKIIVVTVDHVLGRKSNVDRFVWCYTESIFQKCCCRKCPTASASLLVSYSMDTPWPCRFCSRIKRCWNVCLLWIEWILWEWEIVSQSICNVF